MKQFLELLKLYGFVFDVYNTGKGKIRVQMNGGGQLEKWQMENRVFKSEKYQKINNIRIYSNFHVTSPKIQIKILSCTNVWYN